MLKTKFELAKEVIDAYNHAFLQWETMLHIQEWVDEQIKLHKKHPSITIDEDGTVTDLEKGETTVCDCCGSTIKYMKVSFSKQFIAPLQKILDHVVQIKKQTGNHINLVHIRDLNLSHTEYTILNKIANFGLLYRDTTEDGKKIKNGTYWVPQKRIFDFLNWDWKVAKFYVVKSTTGDRILSKERVTVDQIHSDAGFTDYKTKQLPNYVGYILHDNINNPC